MTDTPIRSETIEAEALVFRWMQHDTRARLLLSRAGGLLWANDAADAELRRGGVLLLVGGHITPASRGQRHAYEQFLAGCGAGWTRHFLPLPDEHDHLIVEARVMALRELDCLAVQLRRTDRPLASDPELMLKAFQLTPSESSVLQYLLEGATAQQIARLRRASPETVRVHVRNIYAKLNVDSRGKLLRRLMPYIC